MKKLAILSLLALVMGLTFAGQAQAREVITFRSCDGCGYNITAYDTAAKEYYYLTGSMSGDPVGVTVPRGYGSSLSVTKGRAIGTRNLYETKDPLNPIFEISKKSTYVLEIKYVGRGTGPSVNNVGPNNLFSPGGDGQRQPPPGQ